MIKLKRDFFKFTKYLKNSGSGYFTLEPKLMFTKLRQAFLKAPIFHYFDPEYHIQIADISGYPTSGVLSQLVLDNLGR